MVANATIEPEFLGLLPRHRVIKFFITNFIVTTTEFGRMKSFKMSDHVETIDERAHKFKADANKDAYKACPRKSSSRITLLVIFFRKVRRVFFEIY